MHYSDDPPLSLSADYKYLSLCRPKEDSIKKEINSRPPHAFPKPIRTGTKDDRDKNHSNKTSIKSDNERKLEAQNETPFPKQSLRTSYGPATNPNMCDYEQFYYTCPHAVTKLLSYCHRYRLYPQAKCPQVILKKAWQKSTPCPRCQEAQYRRQQQQQ